jgi:hypothetical protein
MTREWIARQNQTCSDCGGILGGHWRSCPLFVDPPSPTVTWCGPHTGAWCFAEPCTVTWCGVDDGPYKQPEMNLHDAAVACAKAWKVE